MGSGESSSLFRSVSITVLSLVSHPAAIVRMAQAAIKALKTHGFRTFCDEFSSVLLQGLESGATEVSGGAVPSGAHLSAPVREFELTPRRLFQPKLEAVSGLSNLCEDEWESLDDDPQFVVCDPWPRGYVDVSCLIAAEQEIRIRFYPIWGNGPSELDAVIEPPPMTYQESARFSAALIFDPEIDQLRFSPSDRPLRFHISQFSMTRISRFGYGWRIFQASVRPLMIPLMTVVNHSIGAWAFMRREGLGPCLRRAVEVLEIEKARLSEKRTGSIVEPLENPPWLGCERDYDNWVYFFDTLSEEDAQKCRALAASLRHRPTLSVIVCLSDGSVALLKKAVESVRDQLYSHWELCVYHEACIADCFQEILREFRESDSRIKVLCGSKEASVSEACNSALHMATGDFVVFLGQEDELAPHALLMVAREIDRFPETALIYSDEDRIDGDGRRMSPCFKPDWNPDLLTSRDYIGQAAVYGRELFEAQSGFRSGCVGNEAWDLLLRLSEEVRPECIRHIPHVLYHRHVLPQSTDAGRERHTLSAGTAGVLLEDMCRRRNIDSDVLPVEGGGWRIRRHCPSPPPRVSIIVRSNNRHGLLEKCIQSILSKTEYQNFEIIIVGNGSDDVDSLNYLERIQHHPGVSVLRFPDVRNCGAMNNLAVAQACGELIGLLGNDVEIFHDDWLTEMVSQAIRPEIGCVGGKLIRPDGRILHTGVVMGLHGTADHAWGMEDDTGFGLLNRLHLVQNSTAVSPACLLVRRELFDLVGGFDEGRFGSFFGGVDFCLRVRAAGYQNLFTPFAPAYHHGSEYGELGKTWEKTNQSSTEHHFMKLKWTREMRADPAYNPNLSLEGSSFGLSFPPRESLAEVIQADCDGVNGQQSLNRSAPRGRAVSIASDDQSSAIHRVAVHVSPRGNYFFGEIALLFQAAFTEMGAVATLCNHNEFEDARDMLHFIVAPHEYFLLAPAGKGPNLFPQDRTVLYNTEQLHTSWFNEGAKHFGKGFLILDLDASTAGVLKSRGLPCEHVPLGYCPSLRMFSGLHSVPLNDATRALSPEVREWKDESRPLAERPIDVIFFGRNTPRRDEFFGRNARFFGDYHCYFRIDSMQDPLHPGINTPIDTETTTSLSRRAKIALNIHRDESRYFEWHRVAMLSIWQETLVVSEPSTQSAPFVPYLDYVEADLNHIPATIEYLLRSEDGIQCAERIRKHAQKTFYEQCILSNRLRNIFMSRNIDIGTHHK